MINFVMFLFLMSTAVYAYQIYRLSVLLSKLTGVDVKYQDLFFIHIFKFEIWKVISNKQYKEVQDLRIQLSKDLKR